MEDRMQHEAAKPKGLANVEDAPRQESMRGSASVIRRNPSTDQKKTRRQMAKKADNEQQVSAADAFSYFFPVSKTSVRSNCVNCNEPMVVPENVSFPECPNCKNTRTRAGGTAEEPYDWSKDPFFEKESSVEKEALWFLIPELLGGAAAAGEAAGAAGLAAGAGEAAAGAGLAAGETAGAGLAAGETAGAAGTELAAGETAGGGRGMQMVKDFAQNAPGPNGQKQQQQDSGSDFDSEIENFSPNAPGTSTAAKTAGETHVPPAGVQEAAKRALDWIADGKAGDGFTGAGRNRAETLAAGKGVSSDTIGRMVNFFSRHEVDKKATGFNAGEEGHPSPGRVAWDAWGGDAGKSWAEKVHKKIKGESNEKESAKTATQYTTRADRLNPGDQVRTPTGQTTKIKRVRRHETSGKHVYVDTEGGTTVVPAEEMFEIVPQNARQLEVPGYGVPGGTSNRLPFDPHGPSGTNVASDTVCPVCGSKGTLRRTGDHYTCSKCGYQENFGGAAEKGYSSSPQVIRTFTSNNRKTASAIAKRAQQVLEQEENK